MIKICKDVEYIRSVLIGDGEMYDRSSDDYTDPEAVALAFGGAMWLECWKDHERVGVSAIKIASNSVINIHIHIQKQFRGRGTVELGREILAWVVDNAAPRYQKINTRVPVIYKDVIRFAKALGFQCEGIDRKSIMKKGVLVDRQNLGITFDEVRS